MPVTIVTTASATIVTKATHWWWPKILTSNLPATRASNFTFFIQTLVDVREIVKYIHSWSFSKPCNCTQIWSLSCDLSRFQFPPNWTVEAEAENDRTIFGLIGDPVGHQGKLECNPLLRCHHYTSTRIEFLVQVLAIVFAVVCALENQQCLHTAISHYTKNSTNYNCVVICLICVLWTSWL